MVFLTDPSMPYTPWHTPDKIPCPGLTGRCVVCSVEAYSHAPILTCIPLGRFSSPREGTCLRVSAKQIPRPTLSLLQFPQPSYPTSPLTSHRACMQHHTWIPLVTHHTVLGGSSGMIHCPSSWRFRCSRPTIPARVELQYVRDLAGLFQCLKPFDLHLAAR